MTSDYSAMLRQGIEQHRASQWQAAVESYERLLEIKPDSWEVRFLLATVEMQQGNDRAAIPQLTRVLEQQPNNAEVLNSLGTAYHRVQNWIKAIAAFKDALRANPTNQQAWFNLAGVLTAQGDHEQAETCYAQGLQFDPNNVPVHQHLAAAQSAQQKWKAAESTLRKALKIAPDNSDLAVMLGVALVQQERLTEAAEVFAQILEKQPDYAEIHSNLSYVYERLGQPLEAIRFANQAIQLRPDYAPAYNNLGMAQRSARQLDAAIESFSRAVELDPNFALAGFNRGTTELLRGNFRKGWPDYELRSRTPEAATPGWATPAWDGKELPGGVILVYADQGIGDTLQFARFLPELKRRSQARIVLSCPQKLVCLLQDIEGIDEVVPAGGPVPVHDVNVAIASLGALLEVDLPEIRVDVPYLSVNHPLSDDLLAFLADVPQDLLKVGLVWQGNPKQARDALRSIPLETLRPLSRIEGISWFSLQFEPESRQSLQAVAQEWPIRDAAALLGSFDGTAALLGTLDLLISVDTAAAHLAGALGCPVWTMLWETADWRWLLDRDDSPWYPSMRLYRQERWGEWESVVERIANDLKAMVAEMRG